MESNRAQRRIHARDEAAAERAAVALDEAIGTGPDAVEGPPLIHRRIGFSDGAPRG